MRCVGVLTATVGDDVALLTFLPCVDVLSQLASGSEGLTGVTRREIVGFRVLALSHPPLSKLPDRGAGVQWEAGCALEIADRPSPAPSSPPFLLHHPHIANPGTTRFSHTRHSRIHPLLFHRQGPPAYLIVALGAGHSAFGAARFVSIVVQSASLLFCSSAAALGCHLISFRSRNHTTPRCQLGDTVIAIFIYCTVARL